MLHVVNETMQPEFVGLWLKEAQSVERRTGAALHLQGAPL
jgi:hypothetical protein